MLPAQVLMVFVGFAITVESSKNVQHRNIPELPPAQIACAIPKCAPNCRIQTVYDGSCPGCECKKGEDLDLGKPACDPPKCKPGCEVEKTFDGSCPGCACLDHKKETDKDLPNPEMDCDPIRCPPTCLTITDYEGCPLCDCKTEIERTRPQPGICDPPKCPRGCVMETRFTTDCPGCDCKDQAERLKLMANRVVCDPPKCRPGCTLQTIYSGTCPGCECKRQEELPKLRPDTVACDPPRCPAGCRIQTVSDGSCPGCECKDREEPPKIRPDKVACVPARCPAGCKKETVSDGTCPACVCKNREDVPPPKISISCDPPKCPPGCPVRSVEPGPCPVCDCKINEENLKPLPMKIACNPPNCQPPCRIQTAYTGPCPGCDCETGEEKNSEEDKDEDSAEKVLKEIAQCAPPKCQPPCSVQTVADRPCPVCDCKKEETAAGAKPSYALSVGDEYVLHGNTAVMMCHAPNDVTVISWIRDEVITIVSNAKEGGRYSVFGSGELHIRNVTVSDVASYRCKAIHQITQEVVVSDSYGKLRVVETRDPVPPILLDRRTSVSAVQGDIVEIPAAAQGFPLPRYIWYKYGGSDTTELLHLRLDSRMTQLSGSLLIRQVRFEDAGKYSCSISNSHGLTRIEILLTVTEKQKCEPLGECSAPQCTVETTEHGCEVCKCPSRSAPLASAPRPRCPMTCNKRCQFKGFDENRCAICDCNKSASGK